MKMVHNKMQERNIASIDPKHDPAVEKADEKAEEIVDDAARRAPVDPQGTKVLQDQRDRTTGADQASREDMGDHAADQH